MRWWLTHWAVPLKSKIVYVKVERSATWLDKHVCGAEALSSADTHTWTCFVLAWVVLETGVQQGISFSLYLSVILNR